MAFYNQSHIFTKLKNAAGKNAGDELSGGENYYITSFKKTLVKPLRLIWLVWFFMLTVPNNVWFGAICLPITAISVIVLIIYSPIWKRFGYKNASFWLMNLFVYLVNFAVARLLSALLYEIFLWRLFR